MQNDTLDKETIVELEKLLSIHRNNLRHLQKQAAKHGNDDYAPLHIINDMREARKQIHQIKNALRTYGVQIASDPVDPVENVSSQVLKDEEDASTGYVSGKNSQAKAKNTLSTILLSVLSIWSLYYLSSLFTDYYRQRNLDIVRDGTPLAIALFILIITVPVFVLFWRLFPALHQISLDTYKENIDEIREFLRYHKFEDDEASRNLIEDMREDLSTSIVGLLLNILIPIIWIIYWGIIWIAVWIPFTTLAGLHPFTSVLAKENINLFPYVELSDRQLVHITSYALSFAIIVGISLISLLIGRILSAPIVKPLTILLTFGFEMVNRDKQHTESRKEFDEFLNNILLSIANNLLTKTEKIGQGHYGTSGDELVDGVYIVNGDRIGVAAFSTKAILRSSFQSGFDNFLIDISEEIRQEHFAKVFLIFDRELEASSFFKTQLNIFTIVTEPDITSRIIVFEGDLETIAKKVSKALEGHT